MQNMKSYHSDTAIVRGKIMTSLVHVQIPGACGCVLFRGKGWGSGCRSEVLVG